MHNYTSILTAILMLALLYSVHITANAQSFVTDSDRPARSWVTKFTDATKIIVKDSIEEAITLCPKQQYCELMVPSLTLSDTVVISRSRTRLTGIKGNQIRRTNTPASNGFYFKIESGTSDVIIENLNLNGDGIVRTPDVFGIGAYGNSISKVLLTGNSFTGFYGLDNAHAIAFYGTGGRRTDAIEHIIIQRNQISDMRTGSSESIAMNGNVRHWEISNNDIRQINNIAIDAIGGEGTSPTQLLADGRVAPGPFDAARFGFIENNTVVGLSTKTNPAYGNKDSWAAAIYIDGAHSIKVSGNTVSQVPWGLEVGAENCVRSSFVEMTDNQSSRTMYGDILLGGYSKGGYLDNPKINCDPHSSHDEAEGHGYVSRLDVRNNRLQGSQSNNPTFLGNTVLQYRISQSTIEPPSTKLDQ